MAPIKPRSKISPRALLTAKQVRRGRHLYRNGFSQMEIAVLLKISQKAVSMLLCGQTYRGVL